jgi:co-chaperonin GroES (HSP10)
MTAHDVHVFEDGTRLRVVGDSILVNPDIPADRTASGLILYPDGSMEHVLNTGTVLAFGTTRPKRKGQPVPIPGLEKGLKLAFVRFVAEQDSNKQLRIRYRGVIRLKVSDVLVVYPPEEHARVC